ncbi:MAG TPA: hemerythrin domain-containing protein [Kofleriaceae bacterium]|jgi:hemerythrin superfamily protein
MSATPFIKEILTMPNPIDSLKAKTAGAAKSVKARVEGLSGVFNTLAKQHAEAKSLLENLQNNPDKKADLWPEIRKALLSHERGELRAVYPVLARYAELQQLTARHNAEAEQLEALIDRIETNVDWRAPFDQLVSTVIAHAQEEETSIFPRALQVIGKESAKDLDTYFLTAQKRIKEAV